MRCSKSFILGVLVMLGFGQARAQYSFEQITKADGLSHNNVDAILEDHEGFMWFGTRDGLCRYDGYDVLVFRNTQDENSISGNRILSLAEDQEGRLWIGTYQNGLNRYDKRRNEFQHFGLEAGVGDQVYQIQVTADGSVFVGSNNGLAVFNPASDSCVVYTLADSSYSINSNTVSDILETRRGRIFIASWNNEIQEFIRAEQRFESISYIPDNQVVVNYRKRLLEDFEGNIWIAAQTHGLCKYDPESGLVKFFHEGRGALNTGVLNGDMVLSPEGEIWITTDIGGINILDPVSETFEYLTYHKDQRGSIPSDHIYTLYLDRSKRIWVGTFDRGVAYYDPLMNKFGNRVLSDEIYRFFNAKSVISVFEDRDGVLWVGTDGQGLHAIDNNSLRSFYHDPGDQNSLSSNVVTSIGADGFGNVLIGTYSGGLSVYSKDNEQFTRFQPNQNDPDALISEHIWTMTTDSEGITWLGVLGNGADRYDAAQGRFENIGPGATGSIRIGHPNVMSVLEDADGDIWFGTEGSGIYVLDKQADKLLRISTDTDAAVVTEGVIKDLFQDSQGDLWIATEGNGLFRYNEGTKVLQQYTLEQGLPGMIVMGVEEDNSGNLWVSSYDGLAMLRRNADRFIAFYNYDGLSSNEFNAEAFIKLDNGLFVLGSVNGLDIFDPLNIRFNQNIPKIHFTQFSISNKEVLAGDSVNRRVVLEQDIVFTDSIVLTPADKIFSVAFTALNFTHPEKCQYKYRLTGFDDDWIATPVNHRFASYSNLRDGEYIFKVQASNNDGKWGNNTASLHITVLPPVWKRAWFIGVAIALVVLLVWGFYANRMGQLKSSFLRKQALNEKRILELEKENIESELEKLTYYTINRNRVLVRYKNRLQALSVKAKESVKKGLHLVIDEIDKEIADDKEWKYIEPRLDKFHNQFITKLREQHPDLTLSEIKIAAYVRMNLTTKEISEFMHKTTRAVENDRYRLRKKIKLDSNESLQKYLMNL